MFGSDYIELLGLLSDTPLNAPTREFLQRRGEGIERAAFTTGDAAEGVAALRARGIDALGPVEFSRPVDLPDGRSGEATFSVFNWPTQQRPADLRLFACQHRTRDTVWVPELQSHANTATGIVRLEMISPDPAVAAAQLANLIVASVETIADGLCVRTAPGRGELCFLTSEAFGARHPALDRGQLPAEGVAALVLRVSDLDAAARCAAAGGTRTANAVTVAADRANGVAVVFEAA